ncbi:MAG: alkaline phosphatase family protein [Hyphomicrobiaceae bacterium]|nr:alkaline phosphatase family protein [Hyphomicrobiaceae bacterium]
MPESANGTRALIVVFDALRPEFLTPDLMPNLHAFAQGGVRFMNARSTFPSETRVNQSAVTTGCYPFRHGVVANNFAVSEGNKRAILSTGDDVAFEAALDRMSEPLFDVPTLGERLAAAGKSYATVSAGTSGGGRLINISAEKTGSFRFAMRRPEVSVPTGIETKIAERIGPLPEYERPAIDWITYAVDCYLDFVEPDIHPDVMLLWLCEPDESFHFLGIGSPEALRTIHHADAEFGRILARHEREIAEGALQVIAMSDHGQISLRGEPLDLNAKFSAAGFDGANIAVANAGGVWLEDAAPDRVGDVVNWLREQDWCGPIFTADGTSDTLTLDHVRVAHRRAADVCLALRYDDADNEWGVKGMSLHDARYPAGGGCHGGLSPYELRNVLVMSGSRFRSACESTPPASNIDIMPTLLHLLEIVPPDGVDGRVLHEALIDDPEYTTVHVEDRTFPSSNVQGPVTHLSTSWVGNTPYINGAWVE